MLDKLINKYRLVGKPQRRLLDKMLLDGGLATAQNLEAALERKKETNEQLGEALISVSAINTLDLNVLLSAQRDLSSLEDSVKAAAGIRIILEELLLKAKAITSEQLDAALREKYTSGDRLGEVLVRQGLLSEYDCHAVLTFEQNQSGVLSFLKRFRLGGILVGTGQITKQQLKDVIARQKISKRKIGELLVEAGCLKRDQIDRGLKLQQKLVTAAIIATITVANVLGVQRAAAESPSGSASVKVMVTASVLERTNMNLINQAQEFVVTASDIMKGYVAVPAGSRISVKSNNPRGYLLKFEVMSRPNNIFRSISVDIGGREVQLSPNGGLIHQPFIRTGITTDLGYRFELSKDAKPGTYGWPLTVSILRM